MGDGGFTPPFFLGRRRLNGIFKRADHCVSCELGDGFAVLDGAKNVYYTLNVTGAKIWDSLQQPRSIDLIAADLAEAYKLDASRALADVNALMTDLQNAGLVTSCG